MRRRSLCGVAEGRRQVAGSLRGEQRRVKSSVTRCRAKFGFKVSLVSIMSQSIYGWKFFFEKRAT